MVEPVCMKIGDERRYNLHWISEETTYCESKNDFFKKSWAIDHVPIVQTGPTSCRFGRHLSFLPVMDDFGRLGQAALMIGVSVDIMSCGMYLVPDGVINRD